MPKIEMVGEGCFQNDAGILYVEVNSQKYVPNDILYVSDFSKSYSNTIGPIEGMKVTCFKLNGEINFIAGSVSLGELEQHFSEQNAAQNAYLFLISLFVGVSLVIYLYLSFIAYKNQKSQERD